MFYWLIPYLVAYNVSDSTNWRNGPVHLFESEVNINVTLESSEKWCSDVRLLFECKPMNSSTIQCEITNATIYNYQILPNITERLQEENESIYDAIHFVKFNVRFNNKSGIENIDFPEPHGYYREMIVRSIFQNLNVGIDLSDKKYGHYVQLEKSIYGNCTTSFDIHKIAEKLTDSMIPNPAVTRMTLHPLSTQLTDDETIAIVKERKMNNCQKETPYFFGSDEFSNVDRKAGYLSESDITSSQSAIYIGHNRLNAFTENQGTVKIGRKGPLSQLKGMTGDNRMFNKVSESIRLSLISIDDATEDRTVF